MSDITPEQIAVKQFLAKPPVSNGLCACMGPQPLQGQPQCNGANWDEIKREPLCPCAMQLVEEVDGNYYRIDAHADSSVTLSAVLVGPVGGPYIKS